MAAFWTGVRAWCLGVTLYRRSVVDARQQWPPDSVTGSVSRKVAAALTLLRQVGAAGFTVTAVLGDAEFGDVTAFGPRCIG